MPKEMVHVGARIPKELVEQCKTTHKNITNAIIAGLELLCKTECKTYEDICKTEENAIVEELKSQVEQLTDQLHTKDTQLQDKLSATDLQARIDNLKEQLRVNEVHNHSRIDDLKDQIKLLKEQLLIKDQQLDKRDDQIKNLTTITQLNYNPPKMIEAPGTKKQWWKFW